MYFNWKKVGGAPIAKLVDPHRKGPFPKVAISDVFDQWIDRGQFKDRMAKWKMRSAANRVMKIINPKTPIAEITQIPFSKLNEWKRSNCLSVISSALRWYLTGESMVTRASKIQEPSTNGHAPVTLKIQSASIETLADLIANKGKHLELRMQILDAISTCPPGEFRVIPGSREIIENVKERESIRVAVGKSLAPKGWVIRWSKARNVFFVVKKDVLSKIQKGVK